MRLLLLALLALLAFLQYQLWFADGGIKHAEDMQAKLDQQNAENDQRQKGNEELQAQVRDLYQGSDAIESLARSELGLVKKGESFYQIVEPEAQPKPDGSQ